MSKMTIKGAIQQAYLDRNNHEAHYTELTTFLHDKGYYTPLGETPQNTVNSAITSSISANENIFERTNNGTYKLKDSFYEQLKKEKADEQNKKTKDNYTVTIPKGYKGITNQINFSIKHPLMVLTGINGSGKTTILKYTSDELSRRGRKVFFKTLSFSDTYNDEQKRYANLRRFSSSNMMNTVDDVMREILRCYIRFMNGKNRSFDDVSDLYSMLYVEDNCFYDDGYEFLPQIYNVLQEYDTENKIKSDLGIPTKNEIDKHIVFKINKEKSIKGQGKRIYDKYKRNPNLVDNSERKRIAEIEDEAKQYLMKDCRKRSKIKKKIDLHDYIDGLLNSTYSSIDSIVEKISFRIHQDHKASNAKSKKNRLWQEINSELENYRNFHYQISEPSSFSTSYELHFNSKAKPNYEISYNSLSSGEKIIFQLVCYYFIINKYQKIDLLILDEFDANLNPALVEQYINTVRQQFCDRGIKVILTTHSPSTVAEVEANELYEVGIEDSKHFLKHAVNDNGKKSILKKLAPKFVYYSEFGNLEYVLNSKNDRLVLLEGKNDTANFANYAHQYTFIDCGGAEGIKNFINCLKTIPFLNDISDKKLIICLYDFDQQGIDSIKARSKSYDDLVRKIDNKEYPYISDDKKNKQGINHIFLATLMPCGDKWCYQTKSYRHQELKSEGDNGLQRQIKLIEAIKEEYKTQFI